VLFLGSHRAVLAIGWDGTPTVPACSRPISRCWVRVSDYRAGAGLVGGGPMPPYIPQAA
jgi:hypothetical protein